MTEAERNDAVEALRQELAHERRALALAIGDVERSAEHARRRLLILGLGVVGSVAVAGLLAVLLRAARRRRGGPRAQVVARVGDLVLVRRAG